MRRRSRKSTIGEQIKLEMSAFIMDLLGFAVTLILLILLRRAPRDNYPVSTYNLRVGQ